MRKSQCSCAHSVQLLLLLRCSSATMLKLKQAGDRSMSATWVTKYGVRRVRVEPPTFEDALYAAEGLTSDKVQQIEIAASLMQVPVEQAKAEAERVRKERAGRPETVRP